MTQACPCPQTQQCKLRQRCLDIACINNVQDLNKLKLIPTLIQFGYQKWYQLTSSITSTPTNQSLVHSTQWVAYIGPSSLLVCTLFSLIHGGAPLNFVGKAFKAVFCTAHQDDIKYVDNKVDYIYGAWTTSMVHGQPHNQHSGTAKRASSLPARSRNFSLTNTLSASDSF